jgi:hypothetical protein
MGMEVLEFVFCCTFQSECIERNFGLAVIIELFS